MKRKQRTSLLLARALSRAPRGPLFDQDKGDGGGGGGTGNEPAKTFTQADLDRIVGQRVGEATKKYADYEAVKAQAAKVADFEAQLQKLTEEKELLGKSAEEQQRIQAERIAKQIERERSEMQTKLTAAEQARDASDRKLRDFLISSALGSALDGANVMSKAREKAIRAFRDEVQVELDDAGKITSIIYAGVSQKSVADAAAAFLKDNDFYASAGEISGGGSKKPNAGGGSTTPELLNMSPEQAMAAAVRQQKNR